MKIKTRISALITAIITALPAAAMTSCSGGASYEIGICQYTSHSSLDAATEAFKDTLSEKLGRKVKFIEKNADGDSEKCKAISDEFVSDKVDLIFANATPALSAAANATKDIPIIGASVTDYASALGISDFKGYTDRNVSGTSDITAVSDQASMVAELFPSSKYSRLGILRSSSEANSKYLAETLTPLFSALGYSVTDYTFTSEEDIEAVTKSACENSDVIFLPSDNTAAKLAETIGDVAIPLGAPIITGGETTCAKCGIAALGIDYTEIGRKAALQAYEVLANDADIGKIEIETASVTVKKYNPDIAAELGITIPDGYVAIVE